MKLDDFSYNLPKEQIAKFPTQQRSASRLLAVSSEKANTTFNHLNFFDLPSLLNPNDLLIFNDTRVIPARLFGKKATGGKLEIFIERLLSDNCAMIQLRANRAPNIGSFIKLVNHPAKLQIIDKQGAFFLIKPDNGFDLVNVINEAGDMPLPPYLQRGITQQDSTRYQTIYAKHAGAVAAPTAGLHFDENLLAHIESLGISSAYVTLHVGSGTFKPVKVANITEHKMHTEVFNLPKETAEKIRFTQQNQGRVIAVGTTSLRVLEAVAKQCGDIQACQGETDLFIFPGFKFQCVDALITNFHLPKSTLLMLVSAFAGENTIQQAYQTAIEQKYRFYSYGDAMFLTRRNAND